MIIQSAYEPRHYELSMRDVVDADLDSALTELHQTTDDHHLMGDIETLYHLRRMGRPGEAMTILREEIQPQLIPTDASWDVVDIALDEWDATRGYQPRHIAE